MDSSAKSATSTASKRLSAIDIGSNSIRLLVAEASPDGTYQILDDEKRTTRLAQGLTTDGKLSDASIRESLEALKRMKAIAEGYGAERLEVIATSAVREARNRKRFLKLIADEAGLDVEVISPQDEGRLSFSSAARHFDLKTVDAAVVDLGGGSIEVIFSAKGVIEKNFSLPLGAVRLTESLVRSDPISAADQRRLKKQIRKSLARAIGKSDFRPHFMIGAGGTFTALAHIAMRRRGDVVARAGGYELNRAEVRRIFDHLKDLPLADRKNVPGLHADRADIILAGAAVVEQLMKLLRVNRLLIHDQGVRDGLVLRMIGRAFKRSQTQAAKDGDPLAGVRQFAAACGNEPRHGEHVARLALQLFDQLQAPFELPAEERLLLEAAALLHEVGCMIHYEKHHQHSYHLIMHGNLRGLSSRQRELVANIARYHRRSAPKQKHEHFARLSPEDQTTVRRLSAILRLADGLDRTHTQRVRSIQCDLKKKKAVLNVTADKLPEVDLWGAEDKGKYFARIFGLKFKIAWNGSAVAAVV